MARITEESDPARWAALRRIWLIEKEPGWVVDSKKTYVVLKLPGDILAFDERPMRELYESTSFGS
jgi:hypothetical protein